MQTETDDQTTNEQPVDETASFATVVDEAEALGISPAPKPDDAQTATASDASDADDEDDQADGQDDDEDHDDDADADDASEGQQNRRRRRRRSPRNRIKKLVKERDQWKARALAAQSRQAGEGTAKPAQGGKADDPEPEPDIEDFDDYASYREALDTWKKAQAKRKDDTGGGQDGDGKSTKGREDDATGEHEGKPDYDQEELNAALSSMADDFEKAKKQHKDFQQVISNPAAAITPHMVIAMAEIDNPAQVAYYLGKHPEEAHEIAALTPFQQAVEIGRLDSEVMRKPSARKHATSRPISPVSGNDAGALAPSEMSFKEFEARRNKQAEAKTFW